jgi:DNA-binding SARP family transcriptional activator
MHTEEAGSMADYRICLLGKLLVYCRDCRVDVRDSQKAQELLSFLAIHHRSPQSREKLAGVLWGDTATAQSKTYLRKALWQLQAAIERVTGLPQRDLLLVTSEWIQINPNADLWIDIRAFEEAIDRVRGQHGEQLSGAEAAHMHSAAELYCGDLLDGWYCEWCLYERERLQNDYLALLDKLMAYCEAHFEYERGLHYGALVMRHDRAHERTHRRLMRLHALNGDRTAALRQFDRCRTALREELGVSPTPYTLTLLDQIRNNRLEQPLSSTQGGAAPAQLSDVLNRLWQIQLTLTDIQRRVQHEIKQVEQTLQAELGIDHVSS